MNGRHWRIVFMLNYAILYGFTTRFACEYRFCIHNARKYNTESRESFIRISLVYSHT